MSLPRGTCYPADLDV